MNRRVRFIDDDLRRFLDASHQKTEIDTARANIELDLTGTNFSCPAGSAAWQYAHGVLRHTVAYLTPTTVCIADGAKPACPASACLDDACQVCEEWTKNPDDGRL